MVPSYLFCYFDLPYSTAAHSQRGARQNKILILIIRMIVIILILILIIIIIVMI